jgi:SAM-dependent methyltransferase
MNLLDLVHRTPVPIPWAEGEKIPWDDPVFSARMLKEHLSQAHDAASRRFEMIDAHVAYIHAELLGRRPLKVLDLGCGPGLYTSRLARLGHTCVGIDFGPASVAYARRVAQEEGLSCTYVQEDIRRANYGAGYGLAMLIYGEFNVFTPADARRILRKAHAALDEGGLLLLEPAHFDAVRSRGREGPTWSSAGSGLFSDRPHLWLEEHFWDEGSRTETTRYYIVDAASGEVAAHAATEQAYTDEELRALLAECGYGGVRFYPSLTGVEAEAQEGILALVARKG